MIKNMLNKIKKWLLMISNTSQYRLAEGYQMPRRSCSDTSIHNKPMPQHILERFKQINKDEIAEMYKNLKV